MNGQTKMNTPALDNTDVLDIAFEELKKEWFALACKYGALGVGGTSPETDKLEDQKQPLLEVIKIERRLM